MAEVQKLATSDIPIGNTNAENAADAANAADLGTSPPTQERSSNSHPHDSEYDTASDLEGDVDEEEYDEDDTDLDDETDEDDEDDIENEECEPLSGDGAESLDKAGETETQKKVDEDRSNPQYIPKRGTFYEHDDRMADGDNEVVLQIGDLPSGAENAAKGAAKGVTSQSPSISHASKTMKKFQPASASERWTHDRFDASEQQPKSDAEIINQYGFNMRKEANPPRARRRRRYARGPNKYDRKWEDESAYIKPPNKERKPPRASDFPALNERARNTRRGSREFDDDRDRRDEKENRPERKRTTGSDSGRKSSVNDRLNVNAPRGNNYGEERRERDDGRNRASGKSSVQSRLSARDSGRQPAMEFKQKNRNVRPSTSSQQNSHSQQNNGRNDDRFDRPNQRYSQNQSNYSGSDDHYQQQQQQNRPIKNAPLAKPNQTMQGDVYNNNNNSGSSGSNQAQMPTKMHEQHSVGYGQQIQQHQMNTGIQQATQQPSMMQMRQAMSIKSAPTPSNLSQRLQQVQNRNDPSHVGSVQMHSLATQNQQQQQQQQLVMSQPPSANAMMMPQQPQEQRGPPKRYSSMRRSQHDTPQHLPPDAHAHQQQQLQQMHMQPPPPPPQTAQGAPAMMMQDQHSILQANLLQQLYHQENLQAQMQALQVSQQTAPAPQPKQPVYGTNPANAAAYYVADAYGAPPANAQPPPTAAAPYAPQPPAYLPPAPTNAATLAYAAQPQPAQNTLPSGPPSAVYAAGPPQPAANTNQNFSNYQNYNNVGGTTYFMPPAPTTSRPVVLPQRRPTNAIPILPPAEKNKHRSGNDTSKEGAQVQMDAGENIDHIIDNMFVQRPAFQPPQAIMNTAAPSAAAPEMSSIASDAQTQLIAAPNDASTLTNSSSSNTAGTATLPETSISSGGSSNAPNITEAASIASNPSEISSNINPISPLE